MAEQQKINSKSNVGQKKPNKKFLQTKKEATEEIRGEVARQATSLDEHVEDFEDMTRHRKRAKKYIGTGNKKHNKTWKRKIREYYKSTKE